MPFVGSIIPSKLVGLGQQKRRAQRAADERRDDPAGTQQARGTDHAEINAPDAVAGTERTERVAPTESERGREDHEADLVSGAYSRPSAGRGARAGGSVESAAESANAESDEEPPVRASHIDVEA